MPRRDEDVLAHCLRVIKRLVENGDSYYVGITESPIRRWESHSAKYTTMHLLLVAESSRTTADLEMSILQKFAFQSLKCENGSFGGECASIGSPHYLYVVSRSLGLLRGTYREPKRPRMKATVADDCRGIFR